MTLEESRDELIFRGGSGSPNTAAGGFCVGHTSKAITSELSKISRKDHVRCHILLCISVSCCQAGHPVYDSNLFNLTTVFRALLFLIDGPSPSNFSEAYSTSVKPGSRIGQFRNCRPKVNSIWEPSPPGILAYATTNRGLVLQTRLKNANTISSESNKGKLQLAGRPYV